MAQKIVIMPDPVTKYARDVLDGKIIAGELVRLACQRHINDMELGVMRGLYFDEAAAMRAIRFFGFLKHSKGEWAGTVVALEAWQQFRIGSVFGWKRKKDGMRRFRQAYTEVARKNGKTTEMAGIGLYGMVADNEPGAEIYSAASKRDQAKIVFEDAVRMVRKNAALSKIITPMKNNLSCEMMDSKFEALSSEGNTLDGLNIHFGLIDEYHAHPTDEVYNVLDTGTGSRRQPLMWIITTAGFDPYSPCKELRNYAENVLRGLVDDDTFFAYIASLDEGDDWMNPDVWIKANPNLGVSVKVDDLKRLVDKAAGMPSQLNNLLVKRLNVWTNQEVRWLDLRAWDQCEGYVSEEDLAGRDCYGGIDLSSTTDLSSFVLAFPGAEATVKLLARFYLPEENIDERERRDRVPYRSWAKQGLILLTPGATIDYDYILADIMEARLKFNVKEIGFDPYNALGMQQALMKEKVPVVSVRQGFLSLSPPSKEFEKMVISKKIEHGGHKVLRWNVNNVSVETDPAGNIKPSKKKSRYRIDGVVASIIAIERMMRNTGVGYAYAERGMRQL